MFEKDLENTLEMIQSYISDLWVKHECNTEIFMHHMMVQLFEKCMEECDSSEKLRRCLDHSFSKAEKNYNFIKKLKDLRGEK